MHSTGLDGPRLTLSDLSFHFSKVKDSLDKGLLARNPSLRAGNELTGWVTGEYSLDVATASSALTQAAGRM